MAREHAPYANTLALRCTPHLVGDSSVYLRLFDNETRGAWRDLNKRTRRGGPEQVPYSIATTVLRALTGGYVHLDKYCAFLASKEPISDATLMRMFTYLEGFALGEAIDTVTLRQPTHLARLIADTPERHQHLAAFLTPRHGQQPVVPDWVYKTIVWDLTGQLTSQPFNVTKLLPLRKPNKEGKLYTYDWEPGEPSKIDYLPDSDGNAIAWDAPFGRSHNSDEPIDHARITARDAQYALSLISLTMKTLPNITNPVLLLNSRVTRIYSNLVYAKTALLAQPKPGLPLLRVTLTGGGGMRTVNRLALQVLAYLKMDDTPLHDIEQRAATERLTVKAAREAGNKPHFITPPPGTVRPIMPKNYGFSVGTGAGIHHLRLLADHVDAVLGDRASGLDIVQADMSFKPRPTDPLRAKDKAARQKAGLPNDTFGFPPVPDVHAAILEAGYTRLRILCLYYRDETRLRMINCLARAYDLDPARLDPPEGTEISLTDHVSVVFQAAPKFLAHGPASGRSDAAEAFAPFLDGGDTVMIGAFCETEYPDKPARLKGETSDALALRIEQIDAKFQTKPFFTKRNITPQYLLGKRRGKFGKADEVVAPSETDHPAYMAFCDLYRGLGIIDQRLELALVTDGGEPALPRITFCGVHVRKQASPAGASGEPRRIILATALVPSPEPGGVWTMLGWTSLDRQWLPYREAATIFQSHSYPAHRNGAGSSENQRWAEAGRDIDRALADLSEHLDGQPYAVIIDGHACRRIWPGLQNKNLDRAPDPDEGRTWLPGAGIQPHQRPAAVIRINMSADEMPQPYSITRINKDGTSKDSRTSPLLYKVNTDFGTPTWMLFNVPRNYDGSGGGRLGSTLTRWHASIGKGGENAADRRKNELKAPWYTMTNTGIHPIVLGPGIDGAALAHATARLCHQTIAWSDRSRYPAPLHAAKQIDLDHPEYRRSTPPEDRPSSDEDEEFVDE
ncbi:RNaseH domain-containing protein [Actinomadura roseirufa]|uniref:RNaseH domain-containing protein n=1 Tax=Actinomadura roseirufa TaxID=2094049 RepID=UPI0010411826|nr:RNaseH domain-containing protein [Actinomadura roseirufa]